jgi:O-antigen ligase
VLWAVLLLLWAVGSVKGSFAVFFGTLLSAAIATGLLAAAVTRGKSALRAARAGLVVVLAAAVPVVFDPHTGDVFNLPKYTVVVIGALVLAALWAVEGVHRRGLPRWRNGLHLLVGVLVAWTAISALASMDVRVSLLGNYGSYDGLYSAAAFGVIMMTAAEALEVADVRRALGALAFGGGSVVVVYGLIQLHDTEVHGSTWDFINWHTSSFAQEIFSTFGNPNHLGGYLAMVLPAVLVIGLGSRHWPGRTAAGLMVLVVLTELLRTSARGAWTATVAVLVVLAVMLAPELRRRAALTAGTSAGVVAVAAAGMALDGKRFLSHPLSTLFQTGGSTSIEQRLQIWRAAVHIVVDHPLTGIGPDVFALVYPRYQSASWVAGLGANYLVNGAHDIFMNVLADQGFVGLAVFLTLLVFVGLRSAGTWRRLRALERDENGAPPEIALARSHRALLAALSASIVAYVVQASFNVQQVGLSFVFWLLVGSLAALSQAAGVPATLRPAALVSLAADARRPAEGPASKTEPLPAPRAGDGRRPRGSRGREIAWPAVGAAVLSAVVVVLLAVGADRPLRADHDYWAASTSLQQSTAASAQVYLGDIDSAMALNAWEPTYPTYAASVEVGTADHASSAAAAAPDLVLARALLAKAVAEVPLWAAYPASAAQVDIDLADVEPASAKADLAAAVLLARQAVRDNPRDTDDQSLLSQALVDQHKA